MKKPICITFAGPIGSGKTPIAYYLSWNLSLPILNNDSMRTETQEDIGFLDADVYIQKRDERLKNILSDKTNFIYDASVDREWSKKAEWINNYDYQVFIISIDFSLNKLKQIYKYKAYNEIDNLERAWQDHQDFLAKHSNIVNLSLTDDDFDNRLDKCLVAVKNWLKKGINNV